MKTLLAFIVLGGSLLMASGCNTPAYSAHERDQMIARNWNYEGKQMVDDMDHILLLRPMSHMTIWNVQ